MPRIRTIGAYLAAGKGACSARTARERHRGTWRHILRAPRALQWRRILQYRYNTAYSYRYRYNTRCFQGCAPKSPGGVQPTLGGLLGGPVRIGFFLEPDWLQTARKNPRGSVLRRRVQKRDPVLIFFMLLVRLLATALSSLVEEPDRTCVMTCGTGGSAIGG